MQLTDDNNGLVTPRCDRPVRTVAPSLAQQLVITPTGVGDWMSICRMVADNFPLVSEDSLGYWLCHQLPYFQVARVGGRVIGFLHAQPQTDGTLWVNMLAVDKPCRQQGVAHRMVEHFESVCRDWDCQRIGLQCLTTNSAALHLYERHGYARLLESTTERGQRVVAHRKVLPVMDAPMSCPRGPVQLDSRAKRLALRLYYLAWFRRQSPVRD